MSRDIKEIFSNSLLIGSLPKGCQYCVRGEKLVLFLTGLCNRRCWYCTISKARWQKDVMLADEVTVKSKEDVLREAKLIRARGAGITGGEPLLKFRRTLHFIRLLKEEFGGGFHIHLYTNGTLLNKRRLKLLHDSELDEIRFHFFKGLWDVTKEALKLNWDVGMEVPVIPHYYDTLKRLILKADKLGMNFLNLDELEFSERNELKLLKFGYVCKGDSPTAVKGSEEVAKRLLLFASKFTKRLNVHYCSASTKNVFQLRNRWKRRAKSIRKPYEIVSDDGFLVKGTIECKNVKEVFKKIVRKYKVPKELVEVKKNRIETSVKIAELIAKNEPDLDVFIIKEIPIANGWEVERWPINKILKY